MSAARTTAASSSVQGKGGPLASLLSYRLTTPAILVVILVIVDSFIWWLNIPFIEDIATVATITLILVLGFQLFMGNSGILNWSYVGYVGIGAFASALLSPSETFSISIYHARRYINCLIPSTYDLSLRSILLTSG